MTVYMEGAAVASDLTLVPAGGDVSGDACCAPGLAAPLDRPTAEELARLLKAVADPTRLQLVALLRTAPTGGICVCDLTGPLGLSQPTVSHHLKTLVEAGIVTKDKRGYWTWYALVPERLEQIGAVLA